jgi:hypothetical protein
MRQDERMNLRDELFGERDELYRIAKERAEGKRPNVPWRQHETDAERRSRWNAANPLDPIEPADPR